MEIILHIGTAQFIFAAVLVLSKKPRHLSDKLLGAWFIVIAIFMFLAVFKDRFGESWDFVRRMQLYPFAFTFGPFLYLYVRSLSDKIPRFKWTELIHLVPFVLFLIGSAIIGLPVDEEVLEGNPFTMKLLFFSVAVLISFITYSILGIRMLRKHQKAILDHFSYSSEKISLNWLRMVAIGFVVTLALTVITVFFNTATDLRWLNPGTILFLGFTLFAYAVSYFGIRQPAIYRAKKDERFVDTLALEAGKLDEEETGNPKETEFESESEDQNSGKYARSSLNAEMAKEYEEKLLAYMETGQPFLRRDLNIADVAQELDIPQHHLTQTINEFMDKNFYTLVNEYRIEEVKKRLLDKKYKHLTILAIAHDAGFNSKSSFNMIFKNFTGSTPSQFQKQKQP